MFRSEIGSGFEDPGGTPPPRILGNTPPPPPPEAKAPKCPQISQKQQGFFMLAKNIHYKYRKNRKNNKCYKIQDLEEHEGKKSPEMSANIAKVTRIFLAS